jgi:hypothetical protein
MPPSLAGLNDSEIFNNIGRFCEKAIASEEPAADESIKPE